MVEKTLSEYLIEMHYISKGADEAIAKNKEIEKSLSDTEKSASELKLDKQFNLMTESMKKAGYTGDEINSMMGGFKLGQQNLKLTNTQLSDFTNKLKLAGVSGNKIKEITANMREVGLVAPQAAAKTNDFIMALKRAAIVAPVWMVLRGAMQAVSSLIQEQVKFLIELESAMARIRIVGKGTEEEFKNLKDSLVAMSFAYGKSATEALDAAVIFAQQGKTVQETIVLTQKAMLAAQVLGTDVKTVVNDLTAALQGFKIPMENSIGVIDKWIAVEKEFAVTSKDLADATKTTGATANQLGLTISQFLGDVTAVVEVTRKSGTEAARGLGFVYARLFTTGKKTIEQIAKVPLYLDKTGEATYNQTGVLRNASDVLNDVAQKWGTLTNQQRLQIAESLGSKRQMVVLNALMQNYSRALEAQVVAVTSAGQAQRAFNIEQETTKFKLAQVSSAWNNLTNAVGDTSAFKSGLSVFGNLITSITLLIDKEKAYAQLGAKTVKDETLKAEKLFTQAEMIKEIITLREKLSKAPPTEFNTKNLEILDNYLNEITTKRPELAIAIKLKNEKVIDEITDNMQKEALKNVIEVNVKGKYAPKLAANTVTGLDLAGVFTLQGIAMGQPAKLAKALLFGKKENLKIEKEMANELNKQYEESLAKLVVSKGEKAIQKKELEDANKLSAPQLEQLDIARKLSIFRLLNSEDAEKQLKYEYDLIKASDTLYRGQEKTLKLGELQNSILEARKKKLIDARVEQARSKMDLKFTEIEYIYSGDTEKQIQYKLKIIEKDNLVYKGQAKQNELAKLQNQLLEERIRTEEKLLDNELELAHIRGADSKTLLDMEIQMKQQLYPQTKQNELLDYRLKREKEIALEQERQLNISSNAVALMKIAEKFGKGTAFQASQVLTGERGVYNIASDVEAAMKEFMSGEYETIFASDYIRRYGITTPEDIRNQRAERNMRNLEPSPINIKIDIPQINTSVAIASTVDAQGIVTKIVDSVHEELVNPQSKLSKDVNNIFEDYDIQ